MLTALTPRHILDNFESIFFLVDMQRFKVVLKNCEFNLAIYGESFETTSLQN